MSKVIFKRKTTDEIKKLSVEDGSLIFDVETGAFYMDYGTRRISFYDNLYPVGSIIIRDNDEDMSNYLGFTWTKVFAGKVLVGVDSTDDDFKTIGKTGGEKTHKLTINEMPTHNHGISGYWGTSNGGEIKVGELNTGNLVTNNTNMSGGDQAHNNLQPYQVVAYWKRTA